MSYTGTGASERERPILQGVEQGMYPQESATRVTSAGNVSLPAPQSSGWATRTGHGSHTEQPQGYQWGRWIKWRHAPRRQLRERNILDTVHGNGRSALQKKSKGTTDHDTWSARRRRWRYKRRWKRTQLAQLLTHHSGEWMDTTPESTSR